MAENTENNTQDTTNTADPEDIVSETRTTTTQSHPEVKSTVIIDVDKNRKPFDINKITDVTDIEEITNNAGTYRPVKTTVTDDETSTTVVGDGILDRLLETVRLNLDAQRKSGRIRQEEYAQAYVALTQAAIQAAVTLSLQGDIAAMQVAKEAEQIATYQRQRIAYDEDFLVKATQHLLDGYIAFLTSQPNVESQGFPAMYTSTEKSNTQFGETTSTGKSLVFMDGIMSRMYERINMYQSKQYEG